MKAIIVYYKILNLFDDYYTYSCAWNLRYYLYTILYFPLKKGPLMKMSKGSRFYYSDSFFYSFKKIQPQNNASKKVIVPWASHL